MVSDIPDQLISRLSDFINLKIGLYFPENRWKELKRSMSAVARDFAGKYDIADDPISCAEWLLSSPATQEQLDILAKHLTIGETYFFRDKNLFQTLRQNILPELIAGCREKGKSLRIWSAGCCTGEEPYSIAILADQMMPERNITILATDLNTLFLRKAEQGIYTRWSFRDTPEWIIQKYFIRTDEKYFEISPYLKKMVRFSQLNLVDDIYPSVMNNTHIMDIIFCRNVLMYFESDQRAEIIGRFFRSLSEKGWLIFSPSETPGVRHPGLAPVQFPNVTLYRKEGQGYGVRGTGSEESSHPSLRTSYPAPLTPNPEPRTSDPAPVYETILAMADMGKLDEAEIQCKAAVQGEKKLDPGYHYLLATIYQEQGRPKDSLKSLRHALYLYPDFVLAHFLLGNLMMLEGRSDESEKHLRNALSLLLVMKPEAVVAYSEGITAGRLLEVVQSMIQRIL
jgi:chemotaxis protein methyltransferase CheR